MSQLKQLDNQYRSYVGVDEAGRGTLAGSMFFVGVKLKDEKDINKISHIDDSKKTTKEKRKEQIKQIEQYVDYIIVEKTASQIDKEGLSVCIKKSLKKIKDYFKNEKIIYDGNTNYKVEGIETLVKADSKISLVSVASIIAKYNKDLDSEKMHKKYPEYGFINHSGYVNKNHVQAIIDNGWTKYHRRSYNVKKLQGLNIKENK